ncbi:unnamed protein product [Orchesella dallaii]|uniref:Uncharacterized protein n=1 Tax=Orchesella dallaii TaxID=48710 RepID=A0ABP1Q804_9HEXA
MTFVSEAEETIRENPSLSSSSISSELTYTSSNYNNSSASSSYSSSFVMEGTNMTLLNFLEDGLTKLLSLIKQAKNTYRSYYLGHHHQHHHEYNMEGKEQKKEKGGSAYNNRNYSRKERQVATYNRRYKRAVISPSKQRKLERKEPYYWQMLEDNEHQEKQLRRHNLKELPSSSMSTGQYTYSHTQQPHYPHHQQHQHDEEHHQQQHQLGESNSHYTAVASASTGKIDTLSQQHSSASNPASDFHKIRHAMNKLGGLDISVVERMILDTKSNSRSQQGKHFKNGYTNNRGHHHKGHYQNKNSIPMAEPLLTTSTTKTTQQVRQDGLYVANQLRQQQQQLAQSLLPPTVTWFDNERESRSSSEGEEDLPLPSSSHSTGSLGKMLDDDNDSGDDGDKASEAENEIEIKYMYPRDREQKEIKGRKPTGRSNQRSSSPSHGDDENEGNEKDHYSFAITTKDDNDEENENRSASYYGSGEEGKRNVNRDEDGREDAYEEEELESPVVRMGNHHSEKDCYKTDDVLIVVAITCCLNFAFVLVIWVFVRWFSISSNSKEKDFQNLGDCDDTLDPTIVFHGVTEDPCWTLTSTERKCDRVGGSSGELARRCGGNGVGGIPPTPTHSVKTQRLFSERSAHDDDDDMYPRVGSCDGAGATIPTSVMNDKRLSGDGVFIMNGSSGHAFRPEHVPPHIIHHSYSQSMEDLRYLG